MRIKHKSNKKKIIIAILAVVLIGGGAAAWWYAQSNDRKPPINGVDYNAPTKEEKQAGDQAKEDFLKKDETEGKDSGQSSAPDDTTSNVTVTISSVSSGNPVQIRTIIQALDDNGACSLTLTKSGSSTITRQSGTQILSSYSVCEGFDIPTDGLAKGVWQATITYKGNAGRGVVQQAVNIQ